MEGLDKLTKLRCLYLQQNLITQIENVQCLVRFMLYIKMRVAMNDMFMMVLLLNSLRPQVSLRILDISQNRLTKLENIGSLPNLQTLNASKNMLPDSDAISELSQCASLNTLDISNNILEGEGVIDVLVAVPSLLSLALAGNPVMSTPQLRKKMIGRMPRLAYLDRPIFAAERLTAEAWGRGGHEAEVEARAEHREAQRLKARAESQAFRDWKAAKIAERIEAGLPVLASASVSAGKPLDDEAPSSSDEALSSEVQDSKIMSERKCSSEAEDATQSFWNPEALPTGKPHAVPNDPGRVDVASFRAPSYIPETDSYRDIEVKQTTAALNLPSPPPLGVTGSETGAPSSSGSLPFSPPPPPATNFDELD